MIRTLLVANRGEIACRVFRTARRMGLRTVAVHSDADADAPHARAADLALRIGPGPAPQSYLDIAAILGAARAAGADAVHPGYGFLSENADFAEACTAAGLVFVGPPAAAIRAMGDKARAKALMERAGVPVVPGYAGDDQTEAHLSAEAGRLGYPLLIKAAAGGGGRGMRAVARPADFAEALAGARREAENAFGDGTVLLERLLRNGRHVEIQLLADAHGNTVSLGERDCSTQRRHQKVIEEAPSPAVDAALRAAMGADAVAAARAVGYRGAGTVEFLLAEDGRHHFLEMNTRLQVEHPVTELVTGLDLVEWQIRVADGEPLPPALDAAAVRGHAVEARLYAEDPAAGFRPQAGPLLAWETDQAAAVEGVRIDAGVAEGSAVSPFYDPMLAKLAAHGRDRAEAIARLRAALSRLRVAGVRTNRGLLLDILDGAAFRDGAMTTDRLDGWIAAGGAGLRDGAPTALDFALAAGALAMAAGGDWFRSTGLAEHPIALRCGDHAAATVVAITRGRLAAVAVDGEAIPFEDFALRGRALTWTAGGRAGAAWALASGDAVWLDRDGTVLDFHEPAAQGARAAADPARVATPVAGLVRFVAAAGTAVRPGDAVVVVEAMKMETVLRARIGGTIGAVHTRAGAQATVGALLAEIVPDDPG